MTANGYQTYLNYSSLINLLKKKRHTAKELKKKTKIPQTTLYRILDELIQNKVIDIVDMKDSIYNGIARKRTCVFGVKK